MCDILQPYDGPFSDDVRLLNLFLKKKFIRIYFGTVFVDILLGVGTPPF